MDDRHRLIADIGPPCGVAQVHVSVKQLAQAQMLASETGAINPAMDPYGPS
jgi:hypothetical protein